MHIPNHVLAIPLAEYDLGNCTLLFNTLNQTLVELTENEFALLENPDSSNEQICIIEALHKMNMFENQIESSAVDLCSRIVIVPTLQCNKNCPYCYHGGPLDLSINMSDIPWVISYIRDFLAYKNARKVSVIWHGGEPLLKLPVIQKISSNIWDMSKERNLEHEESLLTNGLLLSLENVYILLSETRIREIQISIDCCSSTGLLDVIWVACKEFLQNKWSVTVKYNVLESDWTNIRKLARYFSPLGKEGRFFFILGYLEPHGPLGLSTGLNYPDFIDEYWKLATYLRDLDIGWEPDLPECLFSACVANDPNAITIGPDLFVYRCNVNIPIPEWRVANIHDGFNKRVRSKAEIPFLSYDAMVDHECDGCVAIHSCLGGCHVKRLFNQRDQNYCDGTVRRLKLQVVDYYLANK